VLRRIRPYEETGMQSKAKLLGHSIHQMLIVFPLGLLAGGVIFDVVYLLNGNPLFASVAYWMIVAGLIGGVVAAPFGFIDWLRAIPSGTRAKRIGALHGIGNAVVLLLFLVSLLLRPDDGGASGWAYLFSFAGAGLSLLTAWLGGELVSRLGVGVYEDADPNAPSSLAPARARVHAR